MKNPKVKRMLTIMNYIVSFLLMAMATVDFINGNYWMVAADFVIIGCYIVLVYFALGYDEERSPDSSPPTQQVDLDKDDAA